MAAKEYKFSEGGITTAILEMPTGKLTLRDGESGGSLEVYASWKDYVKDVTASDPVKGDIEAIVAQLSLTLGKAEAIGETPTATVAPTQKKENTIMKNATVATPVGRAALKAVEKKNGKSAKAAPKAAKVEKKVEFDPKSLEDCLCGCSAKVKNPKRKFLQGHDARFHGYCLKIERGTMKLNELTAAGQREFKELGHKVGAQKSA